ncbi:hypothetical protein [Pseudomonas sp. NFX5]|jgi:LAS superfamily LD-carboxypeptidase LdcB|uniref:hypothetical protein n=1 Tax=Pseudomonas sp. NFX5 TaxID=2816961 RepID=UPI003B8D74C2
MSELKKSALIEALQSADWSGVSIGNKALIQAAINELANVVASKPSDLVELSKVEQMAAYYEAPKGFFDWLDLMRGIKLNIADDLVAE